MECKIYKNSKDVIKAIKKSPRNSILIFDEADLFGEHIQKLQAKSYKGMLKKITELISFYKSPIGYGFRIKADIKWDKLKKELKKKSLSRL